MRNFASGLTSALVGWARPSWRPLSAWLVVYQSRLERRGYALKTLRNKIALIHRIALNLGDLQIRSITPFHLQCFVQQYIDRGTPCAAKSASILLKDIFREAILNNWLESNPAMYLRTPATPVQRDRLMLEEWRVIYQAARDKCQSYVHFSMLLALVSAQRRGDVSAFRRSDIRDNHLFLVQQKTGMKIALPLELFNEAIGMSLGDVIEQCPGSDYLLGERQVNPWSLSYGFCAARDMAYPRERWTVPPSFHEQRSLAERLYRDQAVNTQRLLGHKSSKMTDKYNDDRGREFRRLIL